MLTFNDLVMAAKEIADAPEDSDLEELCGVTEEALLQFIHAAETPMSEEEQTWFSSGLLVALRARQREVNDGS